MHGLADKAAGPLRWFGLILVVGLFSGDAPPKHDTTAPAQQAGTADRR